MIEAHELTKFYDDFKAVDSVSLDIPAGTVLALLGPNGAGKTTTVRMLTSILAPSSGWARVAGYDVVKQPVSVSGGQRVDFDAQTTDGIDGFDVVVDFEPVYFDLVIDGRRDPALVFFSAADNGGVVSNVRTIPFGLQGT